MLQDSRGFPRQNLQSPVVHFKIRPADENWQKSYAVFLANVNTLIKELLLNAKENVVITKLLRCIKSI